MNLKEKSQKGVVSLFLAVIIMSLLLAIILGLAAIFVGQIRIIKGMGDSVTAFYAADTGIERALFGRWSPATLPSPHPYSGFLDLNNNGVQDGSDSLYHVTIISSGPGCGAPNHCIRSAGTFRGTRRAIEVAR